MNDEIDLQAEDAHEPTRHYDTVVDAWDYLLGEDLHYGFFRRGGASLTEATNALTDEMLELARLEPGLQLLDVGCGTGKAGCRIAGEFDCQVTGISPSQGCIDKANALARQLGMAESAQFLIGDGTAMQFADEQFDRVWVMESSHLMDDKGALLGECARVLKPGGRLVLCDLVLQAKLPLTRVIEFRDDFLLLKDAFGRARMETLEFYRDQLQGHGLTVDHSRDISSETLATFQHWRDNAEQHRERVEQLIGAQAWTQFRDSCDVLARFWRDGIMGYAILSATRPPSPA